MIRHLTLATTALFGGVLLAPQASFAQQSIDSLGLTVTTTPAIVSDYVFRGLSQTRGRPAVQVTVDAEHSSGVYVGAFVSNVSFVGTNARQEVDVSAGYRFELAGVKLDLGGTYYTYPGYDAPTGGFEANFGEVALRASYEVAPFKFVGLAAYSPNFFGESGAAYYVEGGFDLTLDFGFTLSPRAGYQWVERNFQTDPRDGYYGVRDYGTFSLTVSHEIFGGFIGSVTGVYNTVAGHRSSDCGGSKVCDNRFVVGISRPF